MTDPSSAPEPAPRGWWQGWGPRLTALIFVATVAQLVLATLAPDLPQFRGKAFGARLVAYPLLLLLVPVLWAALRRRGASGRDAARRDAARRDAARRDAAPPWTGFALIMSPFLVDVTGNTFDPTTRSAGGTTPTIW